MCYPVYRRTKTKSSSSDCIRLISFLFLGQYGDYDPNFHEPGFLAHDELLPKRVSLYSVQTQIFESTLCSTDIAVGLTGELETICVCPELGKMTEL